MRVWALALALLLGACSGGRYSMKNDANPDSVPPGILNTPDAVPKVEPRSRGGNPKSYEVLDRTYFVLQSSEGYKERGGASWYGAKFHGHKTSNGETYDMFAMTAAHKTLPLPTYVRVTHLGNGRSVVVRVNDRGPFHSQRIIDLSYTAAAKLDMIGSGSAQVEVEAINPSLPAIAREPERFLEVGSFDDPISAVALREQIADLGLGHAEIRSTDLGDEGPQQHRVLLGPFSSRSALDHARQRLDNHHLRSSEVSE